jgi:hypothetical protein
LVALFAGVTILAKAGGMSTLNAVVVGAWIAAFLWFAHQWKGYRAEKSKAANGNAVTSPAQAPTEKSNGSVPLPPGMKPMIGPQWPIKAGARPTWPKLPNQAPTNAAQTPASLVNGQTSPAQSGTPADTRQKAFVYERPTLPDRKPKLPNNWTRTDKKKPKR